MSFFNTIRCVHCSRVLPAGGADLRVSGGQPLDDAWAAGTEARNNAHAHDTLAKFNGSAESRAALALTPNTQAPLPLQPVCRGGSRERKLQDDCDAAEIC